jgi:hypothetical protein
MSLQSENGLRTAGMSRFHRSRVLRFAFFESFSILPASMRSAQQIVWGFGNFWSLQFDKRR